MSREELTGTAPTSSLSGRGAPGNAFLIRIISLPWLGESHGSLPPANEADLSFSVPLAENRVGGKLGDELGAIGVLSV